MNERASTLIKNWNSEFIDRTPFWDKGPSKFFYEEIIEAHQEKDITTLLEDKGFLKDCYACLAVWGLDRMGAGGPKMKDFKEFREQIRNNHFCIEKLSQYEIGHSQSTEALSLLSQTFQDIQVLDNKTRLVANSKLLHFLLPNLVPVVDQQYIVRYFTQKEFNPKSLQTLGPEDESEFFSKIFKIYNALMFKYNLQGQDPLLEIDKGIVNHVRKKLGK